MNAVLEAMKHLTDKVNTLGTQLQQNNVMLASIVKAIEFNAAEIKNCKTQLQIMKRELSALNKVNAELMERVLKLEQYKHHWNLWIQGIKEKRR